MGSDNSPARPHGNQGVASLDRGGEGGGVIERVWRRPDRHRRNCAWFPDAACDRESETAPRVRKIRGWHPPACCSTGARLQNSRSRRVIWFSFWISSRRAVSADAIGLLHPRFECFLVVFLQARSQPSDGLFEHAFHALGPLRFQHVPNALDMLGQASANCSRTISFASASSSLVASFMEKHGPLPLYRRRPQPECRFARNMWPTRFSKSQHAHTGPKVRTSGIDSTAGTALRCISSSALKSKRAHLMGVAKLLERLVLPSTDLSAAVADRSYFCIGWRVSGVMSLKIVPPCLAHQLGPCALFLLLNMLQLLGHRRRQSDR